MYRSMSVDATLTAEPGFLSDTAEHVDSMEDGSNFISRSNSRLAVR
jgi:hypothetical protein